MSQFFVARGRQPPAEVLFLYRKVTPTCIRPRVELVIFSLNAITSCFTTGTTRIAETFLLYHLSYGPHRDGAGGIRTRDPCSSNCIRTCMPLQISTDSITVTQCSPASLPDPNSEMVSKTWSEKPPTFRMSSRSFACVVP
jgi:hypothetical protein